MQARKAIAKPDSIAAIATASGRGGIGIVRISGPLAKSLGAALLGRQPLPRLATYAAFLDEHGQALDQGIALFFPAPHSFTGEDVLELQGHGGMAVLHLVLQRCLELGARLAQPGEFTQRAFLSGKLDLAQAESVADLINATTSQAARCAMRSMQGEFSAAIRRLVEALIHLRMLTEALLDFPEEEIEVADAEQKSELLSQLFAQLETTLDRAQQGRLLGEGAHIVLVGQPNVGKSSLLNCLSGEEVALVSEIPGTTRDIIRQAIQIEGIPLHILDTAGLRDSEDVVERMGIARTREAMQKADAALVLMCANSGESEKDQRILEQLPRDIPVLYVFNKIDVLGQQARVERLGANIRVYMSAKTGDGLELLRKELLQLIGWHGEAGAFMARERHVRELLAAREHLRLAKDEAWRPEVLAENLRLAQEHLSTITGEFTADDLLGEIFSRFCIGK